MLCACKQKNEESRSCSHPLFGNVVRLGTPDDLGMPSTDVLPHKVSQFAALFLFLFMCVSVGCNIQPIHISWVSPFFVLVCFSHFGAHSFDCFYPMTWGNKLFVLPQRRCYSPQFVVIEVPPFGPKHCASPAYRKHPVATMFMCCVVPKDDGEVVEAKTYPVLVEKGTQAEDEKPEWGSFTVVVPAKRHSTLGLEVDSGSDMGPVVAEVMLVLGWLEWDRSCPNGC